MSICIDLVCKMQTLYYIYPMLEHECFCEFVSVHHMQAQVPQEDKRMNWMPGTGVSDSCKPLMESRGSDRQQGRATATGETAQEAGPLPNLLSSLNKKQPDLLPIFHLKDSFGLPQCTIVINEYQSCQCPSP